MVPIPGVQKLEGSVEGVQLPAVLKLHSADLSVPDPRVVVGILVAVDGH